MVLSQLGGSTPVAGRGSSSQHACSLLPRLSSQQLRERLLSTAAASTSAGAEKLGAERAGRGARAKSDLISVDGVGKRNQELLRAAGILSLEDLLSKYAHDLGQDADMAQSFLRVRDAPLTARDWNPQMRPAGGGGRPAAGPRRVQGRARAERACILCGVAVAAPQTHRRCAQQGE